jgi:hypothetical protein
VERGGGEQEATTVTRTAAWSALDRASVSRPGPGCAACPPEDEEVEEAAAAAGWLLSMALCPPAMMERTRSRSFGGSSLSSRTRASCPERSERGVFVS